MRKKEEEVSRRHPAAEKHASSSDAAMHGVRVSGAVVAEMYVQCIECTPGGRRNEAPPAGRTGHRSVNVPSATSVSAPMPPREPHIVRVLTRRDGGQGVCMGAGWCVVSRPGRRRTRIPTPISPHSRVVSGGSGGATAAMPDSPACGQLRPTRLCL